MRKAFTYTFLLLSLLLTTCGTPENKPTTRGFDQAELENLNSQNRFNYDRVVTPNDSSYPILEFLAKVLSGIAWLFNSVIGYLVLAFLLGLLIWIIVKNSSVVFNKKLPPDEELLVEVQTENIEEVDYEGLLKKALIAKDFRLAVRYAFLRSLKMLQLAELIQWHKEKTNYEYLYELPEKYHSDFHSMVNIYERIWYGKFEASQAIFNKLLGCDKQLKSIVKE